MLSNEREGASSTPFRGSQLHAVPPCRSLSDRLTPEMLYLASFLHLLDSSEARRPSDLASSAESPAGELQSQLDDIRACLDRFLDRSLSFCLLPLRHQPVAALAPSIPMPMRRAGLTLEQAAGLSQILKRDFVALLPFIANPSPLRTRLPPRSRVRAQNRAPLRSSGLRHARSPS